ncbi:DNA polymerase phi-domain-containing protein [Phyllosticta citricarpa]
MAFHTKNGSVDPGAVRRYTDKAANREFTFCSSRKNVCIFISVVPVHAALCRPAHGSPHVLSSSQEHPDFSVAPTVAQQWASVSPRVFYGILITSPSEFAGRALAVLFVALHTDCSCYEVLAGRPRLSPKPLHQWCLVAAVQSLVRPGRLVHLKPKYSRLFSVACCAVRWLLSTISPRPPCHKTRLVNLSTRYHAVPYVRAFVIQTSAQFPLYVMGQKRNLDAAAQDASSGAQKRRRQYTEQDAKLASIFERLADEAKDTRLAAAKELVLLLSDEPSADVANKVLTRLIRGLCSSRKAARSGFFVALSESLRQLYGPSRKEIPEFEPNLHGLVKLVAELTKAEGKASGQQQEKRDHLLGRVFGYKALIQSSILVQPTAPKECWANVLEELYTISQQKSWVREECAMIFYDAVKAIHAESGDEKLVHQIIDGLCTHGLAKTPEGVAIWLTVQSTFPKLELPEGTWHKQDPLCTKERQTLANVMKENFAKAQEAENGKKVKSGSSQTTLNFAWEVVMLSFMQSHGAGESGVTGFSKFWTDIVDNNLFSASASPEQKSKGLQLFSRMLASAPQWALLPLFSPNLMRCIINQRNGSDRYLHKAAATPLDEMRARVKRNPDVAAPIVEGLITRHGSLSFDKITKTKTVEGVLGHASGSALEELVVFFKRLIYRPADEDEKAVEAYRRTISDMLVSLVRSRNLENPIGKDEWLRTLLDVFTTLAYFSPTGSSKTQDVPVPSVSEGSRNMFQQRLSSCLAHLLSSKLDTEMIYPMLVVAAIQNHSSSEELSLAFKAEKSITKAVKQAHKQLNEISAKEAKAKEKKKPALRAFKLLFSLTIIQVYNGDADAVMILDELSECYGAAFQKGEKDANAFQLLTEVILGFASRPSVLFRRLAEQVFTVFASELTPEGLQSMIEILEKKESVSGQQDLFDQQGSDVEEEGEEDEEDEEVDSDVEVVDADGSDVEMAEDESEDDKSGDDGESEDGDGDDEELQKFDALLAETLKTSAPNGTGEDENDSDDDDADMDDDEMMALEPHLTKIFQERQKANSTKKENKDAKENMINFKNRVLDLLLIYVKQQHGNPLAMDTIMPLLQLMRTTSTKQVSEKAANLLKQYFEAAKKGMPEPPETTPVWALLKDVHGEAAKDASKLFAGACSRASLFLAKILVNKKDKNFKKVVDVYAETMKQRHEDPNSKLHPSFFVEWVNWSFAPKKQK